MKIRIRNSTWMICALLLAMCYTACKQELPAEEEKRLSTQRSGKLSIGVEIAFQPIMQQEIDAFGAIYPKVEIDVIYASQSACLDALEENDVSMIFIARGLNEKELFKYRQWSNVPSELSIAISATAIVTHKNQGGCQFNKEALQNIFSSNVKGWGELKSSCPEAQGGEIKIFVESRGSADLWRINEYALGGISESANLIELGSGLSILDSVSLNPNAIGVVGMCWLSDADDPKVSSYLEQLQFVGLQAPDSSEYSKNYYRPYQSYLAARTYPLLQNIISVNREGRKGLGTGFVNFIASEKGQRIILKSGIYPEFLPSRVVKFPEMDGAIDVKQHIRDIREKPWVDTTY